MVMTLQPEQDNERFVRLFVDGQREVLRYILALVPDVGDAHEILQDTAVDLWRKFGQFDPGCPFVPWACRFAFLRVLKHREEKLRRGKYLSLDVINQLADDRSMESEVLEDRRLALVECLKKLSDADRFLIEHRYARQMPVAKLSEVTGQSVSVLYKSLRRVRRLLSECITRSLELGNLP